MKDDKPVHKKNKSVIGFKVVNGQQRFFAYVEQEDEKPDAKPLAEVVKKDNVKKDDDCCGCF
jgi:hypothetical protein